MRSMEEQWEVHATYMTDRIQATIDTIATRYLNQPGEGKYMTLSDEENFPQLRNIQVALTDCTLVTSESSGETRAIDLGEFVAQLVSEDYDRLRKLTRALNQRANGEPLCSGVGIEG